MSQVTQAHVLGEKFIAPVSNMRLAGKILGCHWDAGGVAEAGGLDKEGVAGLLAVPDLDGSSVSGKVARWAAAASVGKYRGPCWPQPDKPTALAPRTSVLTKILVKSNMVKL